MAISSISRLSDTDEEVGFSHVFCRVQTSSSWTSEYNNWVSHKKTFYDNEPYYPCVKFIHLHLLIQTQCCQISLAFRGYHEFPLLVGWGWCQLTYHTYGAISAALWTEPHLLQLSSYHHIIVLQLKMCSDFRSEQTLEVRSPTSGGLSTRIKVDSATFGSTLRSNTLAVHLFP